MASYRDLEGRFLGLEPRIRSDIAPRNQFIRFGRRAERLKTGRAAAVQQPPKNFLALDGGFALGKLSSARARRKQ